jgi:hypothetical protein
MTKEQETSLRQRTRSVKDKVSEFMAMMFATIDAQREALRQRDAALAVIDAVIPECGWSDCKNKATRTEVGNVGPSGRLCDDHPPHTPGKPVEDSMWAEPLRALAALQRASEEKSDPPPPNEKPNDKPKA